MTTMQASASPASGAVQATDRIEQYTIRRQFFKLFGAGFHIYDPSGRLVGYCKQKAFKLKEDLRIFTDDKCTTELLRIGTQQILDIGATYSVMLPSGESLGALRRKGLKSILRDEWHVFAPSGQPIGTILEDSEWKAMVRRFVDFAKLLMPQSFTLRRTDGREIATFRQHFNPFIYRLGVSIVQAPDTVEDDFDDLLILAAGSLIAAIEGRQD